MEKDGFLGPKERPEKNGGENLFFIVGPPRSGTKLLRGILNQVPQVSIAPESHLYPKLLHEFGDKDPFEHKEAILQKFRASNYMIRLHDRGFDPDLEELIQKGDRTPDVIERFIYWVAQWLDPDASSVGDKTPSYSVHLPLLHHYFPEARFVAIIRDPRDRALSIRSTWGKSLLLNASNWRVQAKAILNSKKKLGEKLHILQYEDLLENPEETVKKVCQHLGIPFEPKILEEADPNERLGPLKERKGIAFGNTGKYWNFLDHHTIRRIEELTYNELELLDLPIHFAKEPKKLGQLRTFVLKVHDFIQNIRFHVGHKGFSKGLVYLFKMRRDKFRRAPKS